MRCTMPKPVNTDAASGERRQSEAFRKVYKFRGTICLKPEDHGISFTTYMDLSGKPEVADLLKEAVADINKRAEKDHRGIG